jgi:RNA polymerase sigma factor (sigma-70 family)
MDSQDMEAARDCAHGITLAEVGDLYPRLRGRLECAVRHDVRAPDTVIEDACQFAWGRLVHRCRYVGRDAVLAWLAKVAVHEAFKLVSREERKESLELIDCEALASHAPGPHELAEQHERLAAIAGLPPRQQRLIWLKGLGLSYDEMARQTDCTPRAVERQLLRARTTMRAAAA